MPKNDINEVVSLLNDMSKGLSKLEQTSGLVIQDSQFVEGTKQNFVGPVELSETTEEARRKARFRATRLKEPFDESETPPDELETADEDLVDDYVEKLIDDALGFK